jgi:hypothetical protein
MAVAITRNEAATRTRNMVNSIVILKCGETGRAECASPQQRYRVRAEKESGVSLCLLSPSSASGLFPGTSDSRHAELGGEGPKVPAPHRREWTIVAATRVNLHKLGCARGA